MNLRAWLVTTIAFGGGIACAQPEVAVQALRVRSLAASCAQCHGTDGRAAADSAVPGLAGMPAAEFIEQIHAFRSGARPSTVMQQLARGYSEAQIRQLAAYFAAQPKP